MGGAHLRFPYTRTCVLCTRELQAVRDGAYKADLDGRCTEIIRRQRRLQHLLQTLQGHRQVFYISTMWKNFTL